MQSYQFPEGFLWGAASASYQIEGSPTADGKGESIWDRFSHKPGNIWNEENGDVACDHYRRYEEDIAMMARLGLGAYRFSIAWSRLFPQGSGKPNEKGLDFYRRLVEKLHQHGIKPAITLYHWDLPQALQNKGGWANRDTVKYFEQYASYVYAALDMPVNMWITLNEPWVVAFLGNFFGIHAPGLSDFTTALQVAHNLLLGHGQAVQAFRNSGRKDELIGITLNLGSCQPLTENSADQLAAKRTDGFMNRWFLDPIFKRGYPADMQEIFASNFTLPVVEDGDIETMSVPIDFLGVNNYTRILVQSGGSEDDFMGTPVNPPDAEYTEMGWEVYPRGLYDLLTRLHRDYGPLPLYITENGAAFPDELMANGTVDDPRRINYLKTYLTETWKAMQEGVPVKGYFVWTFMDNFEWSFGYSKRFGIIYVDYPTQKRFFKSSAHWYKKVISQNSIKDE
ncbi:MAG TPA: GH1 family beta-glucosidase [Candidatus Limnocylindrales bacterium]|nr:GH1 family beta-glucosidase [Candidatus Limnocylindrales bacterium]